MKLKAFIVCILLVLSGCVSQLSGCVSQKTVQKEKEYLEIGEEKYYALIFDEKNIGYTHYKVKDKTEKGFYVVEAETLIDVTLLGTPKKMHYVSEEHFDKNLFPKYYKVDISAGEEKTQIECDFEENKVLERILSGGEKTEEEIELLKNTYILDSNMFEHYVFLFKTMELVENTVFERKIFSPQLLTTFDVEFNVGNKEKIKIDEKECICFLVDANILGQKHIFWVSEEGELIALELSDQKFTLRLSDENVLNKVSSVDILEHIFAPSNITFPNPKSVEYLKIEIDVEVVGEDIDLDFLNTKTQKFSGEIENNLIRGVFEITAEKYNGENAPPFPPKTNALEYLKSEEKIEADDPEIRELAQKITKGSKDSWEASQRIAQWVYENIRYEITGAGAKETLRTRKGDCGPHANLTIAMLRSVGVPARMVGGIVYDRGMFGQHYWVEVFLNNEWIPIDPTMGEYGYVDATHVRLWKKGAISTLKVKVLDYRETKQEMVVETKKALIEVGERYRYKFVIDDVEFGYNEFVVEKKTRYNDRDAFLVKSKIFLDFEKIDIEKKLDLSSEFYITSDVRYLYYKWNALVNGERQSVECEIEENNAHTVVFVGEKRHEENIKLEENTYIHDNNHIATWALMYRTLDLRVGEIFKIPVFFPANFLKMVVNIEVLRQEKIEIGGKTYEVFVCRVSEFKEIDYVTADGLLLRIEIPLQNAIIELEDGFEVAK
ncbi:MAG: transglutaminase domain-containing protein [Candidatus Methanofastidiosia archaeon]